MNHVRGDRGCQGCCCFSYSCSLCDGILHQEVVDEVAGGDDEWYWVHDTLCDKCGERGSYDSEYPMEFVFEEAQ